MSKLPLLSIIVPVYKVEKYLYRCIDSILAQTLTDFELILVDDGSPDNSGKICDEYVKKDSRVIVIHQENQGVSVARNHGLNIANGEYIGFVDSDDYIEPDMYELLYNLITSTNADISCVGMISYGKQGKPLTCQDDDTIYTFNSKQAIRNMLYDNTTTSGHLWNKMFKASLFVNLRLDCNIKIREDALIMWDLFQKSNKIVFQKIHKYHYLYYPNSAVNCYKSSFSTSRLACLKIVEKTRETFPEILPYAQYYLIGADCQIIIRMAESKCLNKTEYIRLKREIKFNLTKNVKRIFPSMKSKLSMYLLMLNVGLYMHIKKIFQFIINKVVLRQVFVEWIKKF